MYRTRAAWIDVDLDKLQNNMIMIREMMKNDTGRDIIPMFVLKAQSYGHGIFEDERDRSRVVRCGCLQ